MQFTCKINMNNAAFDDYPPGELKHILLEAACRIGQIALDNGETSGKLRDTNGNTVGEWKITGRRG